MRIKLPQFTCKKDQKLFDDFCQSLAGKTLYFPKYTRAFDSYLTRRNREIKKIYSKCRKLGKSNIYCIMEVRRACPMAQNLSEVTIRFIAKGYLQKKEAVE